MTNSPIAQLVDLTYARLFRRYFQIAPWPRDSRTEDKNKALASAMWLLFSTPDEDSLTVLEWDQIEAKIQDHSFGLLVKEKVKNAAKAISDHYVESKNPESTTHTYNNYLKFLQDQLKSTAEYYGIKATIKRTGHKFTISIEPTDSAVASLSNGRTDGLISTGTFAIDRVSSRLRGVAPKENQAGTPSLSDADEALSSIVSLWNKNHPDKVVEYAKVYVKRPTTNGHKSVTVLVKANPDVGGNLTSTIYREDFIWENEIKQGGEGYEPPVFQLVSRLGSWTNRLQVRVSKQGTAPDDVAAQDRFTPKANVFKPGSDDESVNLTWPKYDDPFTLDLLKDALPKEDFDIVMVGPTDKDKEKLEDELKDALANKMLTTTLKVLEKTDDDVDTLNLAILSSPDGHFHRAVGILFSQSEIGQPCIDYFGTLLPFASHLVDAADFNSP